MKSGASRVKRWISLALLLIMMLSFAAPTFALPTAWYKKVKVTHQPNKTVYEIGESFDSTGLKITGYVYDSNDNYKFESDISLGTLKFSPSKFTKAGKQKVKLSVWLPGKSGSFEWLSTNVTVTVNESGDGPSEWYTDIFVASQPNKTIYTVGESFKTKGLSISAHKYSESDNKKHTETKMSQKDMKISPSKFTKSGKQDVKLSLYLLGKDGKYKWFSTKVQVLVEKGEVKITKHPYGETVEEGGSCGFIARADNSDSRHWFFTKNGQVIDAIDAPSSFPGLSVSGTTKEHLKLSHIPASLNGWSVYCVFYGEDSSATSNKAGIVVFSNGGGYIAPVTEAPAEITPKAITTTPKAVTTTPQPTEVPATKAPVVTEAPEAKTATAYAEGIHCTINGKAKAPIQGDTLLKCVAEDIEGFVFDHWEINGEDDFSSGATATFIASEGCVIRAYYHERKVLQTVNCYLQLLTKKDNASGTKYTIFDFEDAYYNSVTKTYCPGGTLSCYVTAVIPKKSEIDYWLINGVKYQFPEDKVTKFRLLDLNEATTIEPVFKGKKPSTTNARPAAAAELEDKITPRMMHCINCWGRFMGLNLAPMGEQYEEFNFENTYTNPVTRKKLAGGKLDIYLSTKPPKGCTVDTWFINNVGYQFPQDVNNIRVMELNEDTIYEVRFRAVVHRSTATPFRGQVVPPVTRRPVQEWAPSPVPEIN